jgi:HK97 family phage major capsid protein
MNIEQLRRDLSAKQTEARTAFTAATTAAEKEQRHLSDEEKTKVQGLIGEADAIRGRIEKFEADAAMGRAIEGLVPASASQESTTKILLAARPDPLAQLAAGRLLSLGSQFVTAKEYDFFRTGGHRSASAWRSPSIELIDHRSFGLPRQFAATLTEDPASGGKLVQPDMRPGLLPLLFRRLVVADLLASGTTDSNLVSYMVEKTFVNAADTVAEGGTKPESTLTFDAVSDPVRKIAHWLPVTEEMLEDVSQIRSYIDERLRLGVDMTEEDQLLNGTTTAPDIIGIRNRTGIRADVDGTDKTIPDAIFEQMMGIYGSAYLMPDGIVMHPADWQKVQLMKTENGEYVGSGPFASPQSAVLWGLPVVITPAITSGIALVGAFRAAAQVFRKGGIRVEASNSHQDFFIKNLVAIRAEERLALAVYRPGAFGEVINLGVEGA